MLYHPSCKLFLPFENNANDASGNGNHGTEHSITYADGKFGKSAYFAGGTGNYITVPHNAALHTPEMTIAFDINVASANDFSDCFLDKRANIYDGYVLYTATNKFGFRFGSANVAADNWNTTYTVPLNDWVHLAITRSPVGRKLFVGGKLFEYTSSAGSYIPNIANLFIGKYNSGTTVTNVYMDNLMMFNKELIASDIARLSMGLHPLH